MIKKILSALFALIQLLIFNVNIGNGEYYPDEPTEGTEVINNIDGDTNLADSIKYAAEIDDVANAYYADPDRSMYVVENKDMNLRHSMKPCNSATLTDTDGNVYIKNSFDSYYVSTDGEKSYSSDSISDGRVNAIRLGEYYFESHIRDFDFGTSLCKVDKTYHVYGDRLYSQLYLYATEPTTAVSEFGSEIVIPKNTVDKIQIVDKNGSHKYAVNIDEESVEYIAFDIKDVGVVGFIVPSDGSTDRVEIKSTLTTYIVRQVASYDGSGINKYDETGGYENNYVTFGFRIHTDKTHTFDTIAKEAALERNPLEGITVNPENSNAAYLGYEALRGTYTIRMDGTRGFANAYKKPDHQYQATVSITCDDNDRKIYFRSNGAEGNLEAGAVLDDTKTLVPMNVQTCKNFRNDMGEPIYNALDQNAYGDCFIPLSLKKNETTQFTMINIYQNWGKFPLKQLSAIEFHVSYYHLSTGVTETNCIAPYFTMEKDGWLLPDFRNASGKVWAEQPQYNSVGILKFMKYNKSMFANDVDTGINYSEYQNDNINSCGFTYVDIESDYLSDCGSYTYSLRHVEFPQNDENRTFYRLNVTFNKDVTFSNFQRDFSLFEFDGRTVDYEKLSYLDENNNIIDTNVKTSAYTYYPLGDNAPFFTLYDVTPESEESLENRFGCNFGLIIQDSKLVINGKESDVNFALQTDKKGTAHLTLDKKLLKFKAGDTISIDMVLLPWGTGYETTYENVIRVREDTALKPLRATAAIGTVSDDTMVPTLRCENNVAEFSLTGGRDNLTVRVDGFTSLELPDIKKKTADGWENVEVAGVNGYDGYTVYYNDDGTYGFSFVYHSDSPDDIHTFRIEG